MNALAPTLHLVLVGALMGNLRPLGSEDGAGEDERVPTTWAGVGVGDLPSQRSSPCGSRGTLPGILEGLQGIQDGLNLGCEGGTEGKREEEKGGAEEAAWGLTS